MKGLENWSILNDVMMLQNWVAYFMKDHLGNHMHVLHHLQLQYFDSVTE